jgi:hypothetical protein
MVESKSFLRETAEIATFAFWEYFRPVAAVIRIMRTPHHPPDGTTPAPGNQAGSWSTLPQKSPLPRENKSA